jgi:ParB family transcriptional regulator, chromosome partitioning protein
MQQVQELKTLGKGLEALIEDFRKTGETQIREIAPEAIARNPAQPRVEFDEAALEDLAASIARHGVLQPLVVRPGKEPDRYELICGERRLRASRKVGLAVVPCIVIEVPDDRLLEFALVENVQRQDLSPLEVARGYRSLMDRCAYTQHELAERLGLPRPSVANALRLLELPEEIRENVSRGTISVGHARALAALPTGELQVKLAAQIARDSLTVRQTEDEVAKLRKPKKPAANAKPKKGVSGAYVRDLENELRRALATKVKIQLSGPTRGKICIEFYDENHFENLLKLLGG